MTAATLGININYSQRLTWVLSGLVGTVAGVLIASSAGLSPLLAAAALGVFAAIILGGLDSVLGAIVASLIDRLGRGGRRRLPRRQVARRRALRRRARDPGRRPYGIFGTRTIERL